MTPMELAKIYMSSFFGEKPLEAMEDILAEDLAFEGPFHKFNTAAGYIRSLNENPPVDVSYQVLQKYENEHSCCLVYQFKKPGVEATMAQLFEIKENKISRIRLIFDASGFTGN